MTNRSNPKRVVSCNLTAPESSEIKNETKADFASLGHDEIDSKVSAAESVSLLSKEAKKQGVNEQISSSLSAIEGQVRRSEGILASMGRVPNRLKQNPLSSSRDTGAPTSTSQTSRSQAGLVKKSHKPRRRVATVAQRRAANIRERRRMFNLNSAFDQLRKKVPSFAYEKRLSRIETLKLAIMYIKFMDSLVRDESYAERYKQLMASMQVKSPQSGENFDTSSGFFPQSSTFQAHSSPQNHLSSSSSYQQHHGQTTLNPAAQYGRLSRFTKNRFDSPPPSSNPNANPPSESINKIAQLYSFANNMIEPQSEQSSCSKSSVYVNPVGIEPARSFVCSEPQCAGPSCGSQKSTKASPKPFVPIAFNQSSLSPTLSAASSNTITCNSPSLGESNQIQMPIQQANLESRIFPTNVQGPSYASQMYEPRPGKYSPGSSTNHYYATQPTDHYNDHTQTPNQSHDQQHFGQSLGVPYVSSHQPVESFSAYNETHSSQHHQHQRQVGPSQRHQIGAGYTLHSLEAR